LVCILFVTGVIKSNPEQDHALVDRRLKVSRMAGHQPMAESLFEISYS
jgi:hypothetical protein